MKYAGIDVGAKRYFAVWYSRAGGPINKGTFTGCKGLSDLFEADDCVIAIDAPSGCRKKRNSPRRCEEELGIGGYFATPYIKRSARPWMHAGFRLWEHLRNKGFKTATTAKPVRKGCLIEVHPTVIFKKIINPKRSPGSWIRCREPVSKSKRKGRQQRRKILAGFFPGHEKEIEKMNIDHLDALIAAYTAEAANKDRIIAFGDPEEGQIWLPCKQGKSMMI